MQIKKIISAVLCIFMFLSVAVSAAEHSIKRLEYSVKVNKYFVGEIETSIRVSKEDGSNLVHYSIASHTNPTGMAALLLGGKVTDRCEFTKSDELGVKGLSYSSTKEGKSHFGGAVTYDWANRIINYDSQEKAMQMPEGYLLDNCNFYPSIALTDLAFLKSKPVYVVDAKDSKYRGYIFDSLVQETLATDFGELATSKITLVRDNNANRQLVVWLSDSHKLAPVKIMDKRKNRTVTLTLLKYDNESVDPATL